MFWPLGCPASTGRIDAIDFGPYTIRALGELTVAFDSTLATVDAGPHLDVRLFQAWHGEISQSRVHLAVTDKSCQEMITLQDLCRNRGSKLWISKHVTNLADICYRAYHNINIPQ